MISSKKPNDSSLEQKLIDGLRRIDAPYRQALTIFEEASQSENQDPPKATQHAELSEQLRPSMQLIATCEEQLMPLRKQWQESGGTPGDELQQLLSNQTDLLNRLIHNLNLAEADMVSRQEQLGNQIDKSSAHVAMRQAYHTESA